MMNVNLKSAFLCSKAVLPRMMEQKYGKIVNVSARTAVQRGSRARSGAYAVSKAGVVTLTEALAEETKDQGIQVNCIMPSTIDTEANRKMLPKADFTKWVDPEEIAEVIMFLVSDASKPTSGASIPVYGRV
jgi:NAD(P)-dependent dehydrogenase (short-subunit alcohol dehydrogenase family)